MPQSVTDALRPQSLPQYLIIDPVTGLRPYGGPGRTATYRALRDKRLRAVKLGRSTRITAESFLQMMQEATPFESAMGARS